MGEIHALRLTIDLTRLVRELIPYIDDDYRATGCDDDDPSMDLTVGVDPDGRWSYQTGDNSFMGGAYHSRHWGVITIARDTRPAQAARDLVDQALDAMVS